MYDAITRIVNEADAQGRFLSGEQPGEPLEALGKMVAYTQERLAVVNWICSNASTIIVISARSLFTEQSHLIAPGGNAYTTRRMAAFLREMSFILRWVNYTICEGNVSVLDELCLNGLRETYVTLGVPGASVALAIQKMKEIVLACLINPEKIKELVLDSLTHPEIRPLSEIRKLYPKQWVTIEVTKFKSGFPLAGKVLFYDINIETLSNKIDNLSGDIYTFFTGSIDEQPEPLYFTNIEIFNPPKLTEKNSALLSGLAFCFDRAAASIA